MGFGKKRYNAYRKRSFTMSDSKRRQYAQDMENIRQCLLDSDWVLSSHQDSAYKTYPNYEVRLSNHSADNQYHDLHDDSILLVNIKASKLDFFHIIETKLDRILAKVDALELDKYRFINVTPMGNINCYLKGYKTKKDVFTTY